MAKYYVEQFVVAAGVPIYNVRTDDKALAACQDRGDCELIVKALNMLEAVRNRPADTVGNLGNRYPIERLRESQGRPIHG